MNNKLAQGLVDVVLNSSYTDDDLNRYVGEVKSLLSREIVAIPDLHAGTRDRLLELELEHRKFHAMKRPEMLLNVVSNPDNKTIDEKIQESIRAIYGDEVLAEAAIRAVHEEELLIIDSPLTAAQVQKPMGNRKQRRAVEKMNRAAKISSKTK